MRRHWFSWTIDWQSIRMEKQVEYFDMNLATGRDKGDSKEALPKYIKSNLCVGFVLQILTHMTMCLCKELLADFVRIGKCASKHCYRMSLGCEMSLLDKNWIKTWKFMLYQERGFPCSICYLKIAILSKKSRFVE